MEFFDLVKNRRSVRKYKAQPVDKKDILKILDAANWAPSAMNWQPWEFIVVSGKLLKPLGNSFRSVVEKMIYESEDNETAFNEEFVKFAAHYGGAPAVIVVLTKTSSEPNEKKASIESASAAMQNLILAAADLGLGTCWMTGPLRNERGLRDILDIPDDREIVAVTPLGYPDKIPKPLPRLDAELKQKIRWLGY